LDHIAYYLGNKKGVLMKRVVSLGLLSLGLITGCSSIDSKQQVAYQGIDSETMAEWSKPFSHTVARKPSSEIVSSTTYHWEADTLKIPLSVNSRINQTYNVQFSQYAIYDTREQVRKNIPVVQTVWDNSTISVQICDEQGGTGKSEYWNAFFSAPGSQKASALANAIAGVGDSTAKNLIKNNYFNSKPRSWNDFENEIHRAAQSRTISNDIEYQVLYKFRSENMAKLGYNTQVGCHFENRDIQTPREVLVDNWVYVDEIVPHRDLVKTDYRQYDLSISGQRLQSFESEMLVFSFDYDSNQISLSPSSYTNFSISMEGRRIVVTGNSRRNTELPSDVLPTGATLESSGGKASFNAPINRLYIPKTAAEGQLMVSIEVHSCKKGLFGGCALTGKDEQVQPVIIKVAQAQSGLVNHQFTTLPKRKYWVRYWVNVGNSPWYINNVVVAKKYPEI
jgi:hypothetical protein